MKNRLIEHFQLQVDAARAIRATIAFAIPLLVCHLLHRSAEALFVSAAALNLSLPDLRGPYGIRLSILATMTSVAAASAMLGVVAAGSAPGAVLAMGGIALLGGFWRHVSADYGPSMAVSSALLFLLGLAQPGGWSDAGHLAELVALGGATAAVLHAGYWIVRPQYGLRNAVAETWVATADLVAAMRREIAPGRNGPAESFAHQERELRTALDRTFVILGAAENRKQALLISHLEEMRLEVVHITMRIIAFNTSLETLTERPDFKRCLPVIDSVLKALSDAARSVAITLIMHRPENLAASGTRLRRCQHLIEALDEQLGMVPNGGVEAGQARATLRQIERLLPRIQSGLQKTVDHASPRPGIRWSLPDLSARSIQSLGAWIRPEAQPDPVLIRHALRMAVFTMLAVALYKGFGIPRGYWIAFTIMVVLQPDYGSTRQRAGARLIGTVAGSVLASVVLWIELPLFLLDGLATITAFFFAYFVRPRYGLAIFFVTINLVLITETLSRVHQDFMIVRVLSTLLGGGLALVAARIFWPLWEGEKFPNLLSAAIRANLIFLQSMAPRVDSDAAEQINPMMAKRRAENANRYVAASVERLLGEPSSRQEMPERAAALATYNQRVTRALTALAVHLPEDGQAETPAIRAMSQEVVAALEDLARAIEAGCEDAAIAALGREMETLEAKFTGVGGAIGGGGSPDTLTVVQLGKTIAEIRAMTLALRMTS